MTYDVATLVSHAAQEYLRSLLEKLNVIAQHRLDLSIKVVLRLDFYLSLSRNSQFFHSRTTAHMRSQTTWKASWGFCPNWTRSKRKKRTKLNAKSSWKRPKYFSICFFTLLFEWDNKFNGFEQSRADQKAKMSSLMNWSKRQKRWLLSAAIGSLLKFYLFSTFNSS